MFGLKSLVILISTLLPLAVSGTPMVSQSFQQCQRKTSNPLEGCPPKTIYVSQNDTKAQFKTIQGAINSVPNNTAPYVILIAPGKYVEQLNVTRQGPLYLLGMSDRPWRSQPYADIDYDSTYGNDVIVEHDAANHNVLFPDNVYTGVLTVGPTLNATETGAGPQGYPVPEGTPFGCSDFRAYNIDFHNEAYPFSNGPAHALGMGYANGGFYSCGFYSWQDTIFIGKLANAYFYDSIVAGQTDFLYGFGTLYIEKSTLSLRSCGGGITAWKGTNTTFVNKYGVYISDSKILAANSSIAAVIKGKCSLGRPWNAGHRSLYSNTYFDPSILPAGYTPWAGAVNNNMGPNTTMAVYKVYGPGYNETAEKAAEALNITLIFDDKEARPYLRPVDVFMTPSGKQPNIGWIDPLVLAFGK